MPENAHEGITIEFRGESVQFDKTVNAMNHAIRALRKDISGFNKELKFNPNNLEVLNKQFKDYEAVIEATNKKLEYLRHDLAECVDANGKVTDPEKWVRFQAEITDTQGQLLKLEDAARKVKLRIDNIDAYRLADSLEQVGKTLRNVGSGMERFGRDLMPVSLAASAGLGGAAKAAMDFESALTGVYKTVDETPTTKYEDIEKWIRTLATELPATASEIANVAEMAGQLGISADALEPFVKTMIDLGNATNISSVEGAKALAQFFNIMGYSAEEVKNDVDNFGAALTALGNNSATTEEDILYMAKALAAAGNQIGLTSPEVLGLATTLSSLGLSAERGGSAISTIFRKIETDVNTVSKKGSERLASWGELIGMTGEEFRKAWGEDTIGTIEKVVIGLGTTEDISKSLYEVLQDVDITNIRQVDTVTRLANAEGMLSKYIAMSNEEWEKNSALSIEANRRYGTTASQLQILKNNITEVGITLGETLLPVINDILQDIKPLVKGMRDFVKANGDAVTKTLAFVSALAPGMMIFGKITKNIGNLAVAVSKYTKLGIEATGATQTLAKVLGTASSLGLGVAVGAAVLGLGALAVAIIRSKDETIRFKKEIDRLNSSLDESVQKGDQEYNSRLAEAEGAMIYAKRLDEVIASLDGAEQSEEDYASKTGEIQSLIGNLNTILGENVFYWNEETHHLEVAGQEADSAAESYRNLMAEMRRTAWLETHQQALQEAYEAEQQAWELSSRAIDEYANRVDKIQATYSKLQIPPEVMQSIQEFTSGAGGSFADIIGKLSQDDSFMAQFSNYDDMVEAVAAVTSAMSGAYDEYNTKMAESNELLNTSKAIQSEYQAVMESTAETFPEIIAQQTSLGTLENESIDRLRIKKQLLEEERAARQAAGDEDTAYLDAQIAAVDEAIAKETERLNASNEATDQASEHAKTTADETATYQEQSNVGMNATVLDNNKRTWNETEISAKNVADAIKTYFDAMVLNPKELQINAIVTGDGASLINSRTMNSYGFAGRSGGFNSGFRSGGYNVTINPTINVSGEMTSGNARRFAMQMVDIIDNELGARLRMNG